MDTKATAGLSAVVAIATTLISSFTTIYVKTTEFEAAYKKAEEATKIAEQATKVAELAKVTSDKLIGDIQDAQKTLGGLTWASARLEPEWSNYGKGYSDPSYAKDRMGIVHLRGLAKSGGQGSGFPLMILPEAFRPEYQHEIVVACNGIIPCEVMIETGGKVWFEAWDQGWVSLDGVSFASK